MVPGGVQQPSLFHCRSHVHTFVLQSFVLVSPHQQEVKESDHVVDVVKLWVHIPENRIVN